LGRGGEREAPEKIRVGSGANWVKVPKGRRTKTKKEMSKTGVGKKGREGHSGG